MAMPITLQVETVKELFFGGAVGLFAGIAARSSLSLSIYIS
jgi:hypothetical protein